MHINHRLELASSREDVERLRSVWSIMQYNPETDIDFYLAIVRSRSNILRPHVVVLYNDKEPVAMMVARLEQITLNCKVGYHTFFKIPVRSLTVLERGMLGQVGVPEAEQFVDHIQSVLRQGDADVAYFAGLRTDCDMLSAVIRKVRLPFRDFIIRSRVHWVMDLPGNAEKFWDEIRSKHRKLRRRTRGWQDELERDFGGKVDFQETADFTQLCNDAEEVAKKAYQRSLEVGFEDNDENRQRLSLLAGRGDLRGYLLYVNRKPVSFWIGTAHRESFFPNFTGYDPSFKKYRPGTLVFTFMIERLCKEGIRYLDFGTGDADYKHYFGDRVWSDTFIYLYSPRLRSIGINILRTATLSTELGLSFLLRRFNLLQKVKTIWRRGLTLVRAREDAL